MIAALDNASNDKELFDAASAIVAVKKTPGKTFEDRSFLLHAPLELCARYYLLPLVEDTHVAGARKQIRLLAKKYYEYENAETAAPVFEIAPFEKQTVDIEYWATSLLFAGHGTILLGLQHIIGETNSEIESVLQSMQKEIESDIANQMKWSNQKVELTADLIENPQDWFVNNIGNIEKIQADTETIKGQVRAVEQTGAVDRVVQTIGAIATFSQRANYEIPFQILMRTMALSMIVEEQTHAKFGWTHALTIPHSHWVLSANSKNPARMLQAAAAYAATFRSTLGNETINQNDFVQYFEEDESAVFAEHYVRMGDIISRACELEDAHLIKYCYSTYSCMKRDPHYAKLYIEACAKLLAVWERTL